MSKMFYMHRCTEIGHFFFQKQLLHKQPPPNFVDENNNTDFDDKSVVWAGIGDSILPQVGAGD